MKLVIGICGSSGAILGLKFLSKILHLDSIDFYLVVSEGAKRVFECEDNFYFDDFLKLDSLNKNNSKFLDSLSILKKYQNKIKIFNDKDLSAPISSGSFCVDAMSIIPCSSNSLAKISYGINDTLITRSALVCLKERKKLLIAPREMPLSTIMLQNMLNLSKIGVIISPPILGYYSNIIDLESMENFLFGKWLDSLNIDNVLFKRWN